MKTVIQACLLSAAVSTAAIGCQVENLPAREQEAAADDALRVKSVQPQRRLLEWTTTQPATVVANYEARLHAKVAGYLATLTVDIGDSVAADDVLGVIDVPELEARRRRQQATIVQLQAEQTRASAEADVAEARIPEAQARLGASRLEFERLRDLAARNAVEVRLRDEAQERFEASQAGVAISRAQASAAQAAVAEIAARIQVARMEQAETDVLLGYAVLKAPIAGIVTERHVDPGDLVQNIQTGAGSANRPLFVIAQLDTVRVRVAVPENEAPAVDVGDPAVVKLRAMPRRPFTGVVSRLARRLDESTRTMHVEIDLPNPNGTLMPGMYGEATITLERRGERLVLPAGAVRHDERGRPHVYVVDARDTVEVVPVSTGLDDGREIEILSGLAGNERVVLSGFGRLQPGQPVRVE